MDMKKIKLEVPSDLLEEVQKRVEDSDFNSLSEYITFVLKEIVADEVTEVENLTRENEEQVKKRLKGLGYLE